jgi:hypothetical protein
MRKPAIVAASLVALWLLIGTNAAFAAPACTSYDTMSELLAREYAEIPVAGGLAHTGKLLQVFAAKDGSSWTVVLTRPDGMSCIVAAGRYWQTETPKDGPQV